MKLIKILFTICVLTLLFSCADNMNDTTKRNNNWCWWVDDETHIGKWIPVSVAGNVKNGQYTLFYSNGVKSEIGKVKNSKNYDTTFTFNIQGILTKYTTFRNDSGIIYYKKDGIYIDYYSDCKISTIGQVKNHDRANKWTWFYKSGKIKFYEVYRDSLDYSYNRRVSYFDSGRIKDSSNHCNHKQFGLAKAWHSNGKLRAASNWKDGEMDGTAFRYFENGKIKSQSFYVSGVMTEHTEWDEDGKIKK